MSLDTKTEIGRVESATGQDDYHVATDEAVRDIKSQGLNGPLYQAAYSVSAADTSEQPAAKSVPDGVPVDVQAMHDNTGVVLIGDSGTQARALEPRESVSLRVSDLSDVYVQAPNAGDGVVLTFEEVTA